MSYTTIKIPTKLHRKIKDLSQLTHTTQYEVLENSLLKYEKELFWADCVAAYEKNSKIDNNDENYSGTLMDGLDDEY